MQESEKNAAVATGKENVHRSGHRFSEHERIDQETIAAFCQGDTKAFDIIYLTYRENIEDFLTRLTSSPGTAQEITQELFVYFWEHRASVDPKQNVKGFLFTMARNRAINYIKREKRLEGLPDSFDEQSGAASASPHEYIIAEETRLLLELAVLNMPEQRREVYTLSEEGYSYEQIAQKLGITQENARKHLSRARKDLKILRNLILFFSVI